MIIQHSATQYEWDGGSLDFDFLNYVNDKRLKLIPFDGVYASNESNIPIETEVNYKPVKVNTSAPKKITERIHRDKLIPIMNIIHPVLERYGRFDLCGSYRRGKETVKDMDYVIQTSQNGFWNLRQELQSMGIHFTRGANEIMNGIYCDGIGIDFFRAEPDSYISMLIWRTGSKKHNIFCANVALRQGMKILSRTGIQLNTGEIFHPKTEQEFYDCLGIKFIPPNQRDMEV